MFRYLNTPKNEKFSFKEIEAMEDAKSYEGIGTDSNKDMTVTINGVSSVKLSYKCSMCNAKCILEGFRVKCSNKRCEFVSHKSKAVVSWFVTVGFRGRADSNIYKLGMPNEVVIHFIENYTNLQPNCTEDELEEQILLSNEEFVINFNSNENVVNKITKV